MPKKPEEIEEVEEVEETDETEETDEGTEDEGWSKLQSTVKETVSEAMAEWQSKQKPARKTSSPLPRKQAVPARKQGFLTGGFFKGLAEKQED